MTASECSDNVRLKAQEGMCSMEVTRKAMAEIERAKARNWLAHDGLWFQAVARRYGMVAAVDADRTQGAAYRRKISAGFSTPSSPPSR